MIISSDIALGSRYSIPPYAKPRFGGATDARAAPDNNPHWVGRYAGTRVTRPRFNSQASDPPAIIVIDANPHFAGRYAGSQLRRFLFNSAALDVPMAPPPPPPPFPSQRGSFLHFSPPSLPVEGTICPPEPATPPSFSDALTAPAGDALLPTIIAQTPRGAAWRTDEVQDADDNSFQHRFWRAVADPISALYTKAWKLTFASTACTISGPEDPLNDSLEDWETEWGLPDPCTADLIFSVAQRKLILRQKVVGAEIVQWGGQSANFFVCLAQTRGYTIAVLEYRPLRCGQGRCGRTQIGGPVNEVFWQVFVATQALTHFHCGDPNNGMCGRDPLGGFGRKLDLECELNTWKPAHTQIRFHYIYVPSGTVFDLQAAAAAIEADGTGFEPRLAGELFDDLGNPLIDEFGNPLTGGVASSIGTSSMLAAPVNATIPAITGVGEVGQTLAAANGTWTNSPTAYAYQWLKDGAAIAGQISKTYVPASGDISHTLSVNVIATNGAGSSSPATSSSPAFGLFSSTLSGATQSLLYSQAYETNHAKQSSLLNLIAATIYTIGSPAEEGSSSNGTGIITINRNNGAVATVVAPNASKNNSNPVWGVNGEFFVYSSTNVSSGNTGGRKYVIDGGIDTEYYAPTDINVSDFSLDASNNLLMSGYGGLVLSGLGSALFIRAADTGVRYQLTTPTISGPGNPQGDFDPSWSPDGTKAACVRSTSAGIFGICVITVGPESGGTPFQNLGELIIPPIGSASSFWGVPSWSSDGTKIISALYDPLNLALNGVYSMNADGTGAAAKIALRAQEYYNTPRFVPGSPTNEFLYAIRFIPIFP